MSRPLIKILFVCLVSLSSLVSCDEKKTTEKTFSVLPLEFNDKRYISDIAHAVTKTYGMSHIILEEQNLPESAFVNIKTPRYRADKLIAHLKSIKPDSVDYIIAFTSKDISTTKKDAYGRTLEPKSRYTDWGIFGLGYRPGPSCIVSGFRLKNSSKEQKLERYKKIAIHEIGHNLGLKHCPNKKCVMTDACESVRTIDNVRMAVCQKCRSKI